MGIISEKEARKVLAEYEEKLAQCVRSAWSSWHTNVAPHFMLPRGRVTAGAISGLLEKEIRMHFGAVPGVHLIDKGQRLLLWVRGKLLLRFKKVDGEYHTNTYPTPTSVRFDSQQFLPLYEDLPRVTVGYRLNQLQSKLLEVPISFAVGEDVKWVYAIYENGGEHQMPLIPNQSMPTSDSNTNIAAKFNFQKPAPPKKKRITVKKPQEEKKQSGTDEGGAED